MISAQQAGTFCILMLVVSGVIIAGCTDGTGPVGEVSIGYVLWNLEIASTNVLKTVYEQTGYDVELKAVDVGALYQGISDGQVNMSVSSWMPATHAAYRYSYGDNIVMVGKNLEGAKVGLVVPTYVTIDPIDEMNRVADQFNGKIIGIGPGAGMMVMTERVIENYSPDYTLVPSSSACMAARLSDSYENDEWVAVTGWTPHWKFVRFDLKYLEDPQGIYGGEE